MFRSACRLLTVLTILASAHTGAAETADQVIQRFQLEQSQQPAKVRPGWRKPKKILVGGSVTQMIDELRRDYPDIEFIAAKPDQAAVQAKDADAAFGVCSAEVLEAGKSILWIHLVSAGVENCVSVPGVRERDILLTNMQRIGGPVIAEHVMAMTLAFTRGLDLYIPQQAKREWRRVTPPGRMEVIKGKTMLVVGLGGIGSEVAKRAHGMEMKVIATRASGRTGPDFVSYVGLPEELPKLAADADFVVNTAPLTPQTKGIFNAAFFSRMKPGAYFINIGRGGSVDTDALVAALKNQQIAGAGLDVTDPEPLPPDHPLWQAPNVIITPHVSNDSDLGVAVQVTVTKENLRRYIAGERMLSVVDVSRGY
ncbi:D-2-hydroxyacid dehydrogenase [Povalibacter sp.]|uniref:D-2-hydroxyacid dehydrogenase n=1 Tax=Povalibacter sp. TaxID=1962978 RepID=UPI002F41894A